MSCKHVIKILLLRNYESYAAPFNTMNRKNPKNSDIQKNAVIVLKFEQRGFYHRVMLIKDADGMQTV